MAEHLVPPVEPAGVSAQKLFHASDQVRLRRLDHEMKMIRHEDIGMNLPARLGACLSQGLEEPLPIPVILEDRLAPVPAIHDVLDGARILDSQLAGLDGRLLRASTSRPRIRIGELLPATSSSPTGTNRLPTSEQQCGRIVDWLLQWRW